MSFEILLVEDKSIVALDFQLRLEERGYKIDTVSSGEMALKEIQKKKYDLIVIDVSLSGRVDGIGVAMQIRTQNSNIPMFFVSSEFEIDKIEEKDLLHYNYLSKPIGEMELKKVIGSYI